MVIGKIDPIAKKTLGQHWLKDELILDQIVDLATLNQHQLVVEIGPGLGDLTSRILRQTNQLIAIEIDQDLNYFLKQKFDKEIKSKQLRLFNQDIRKFDFSLIENNYKIIANIPYYLTSNLLKNLTEIENKPIQVVLLVQDEVARRITAKKGDYSILSISLSLYYRSQYGFKIDKNCFEPPPKVDSATIVLDRLDKPLFEDINHQKFLNFVKISFKQKRKKIINAMSVYRSKALLLEVFEELDLSGNLRCQNLSLQNWHDLFIKLH